MTLWDTRLFISSEWAQPSKVEVPKGSACVLTRSLRCCSGPTVPSGLSYNGGTTWNQGLCLTHTAPSHCGSDLPAPLNHTLRTGSVAGQDGHCTKSMVGGKLPDFLKRLKGHHDLVLIAVDR